MVTLRLITLLLLVLVLVPLFLIIASRSRSRPRSGPKASGPKATSDTSCFHKDGFKKVLEYFQRNPNSVVIEQQDFKDIVQACEGSDERALLCIANAVAYKSVPPVANDSKHSQSSSSPCVGPAASHTVVSNYPVGACVLSSEGRVYIGANFEFNGMLIPTVHGEQCAVHNALVNRISQNEYIRKLAVNAAPCGSCRQYLVEIGNPSDLQVIFCSNDNNFSSQPLDKMIIENFGPINLGVKESIFNHTLLEIPIASNSNPYSFTKYNSGGGQWRKTKASGPKASGPEAEHVKVALDMWKKSYAPYTNVNIGIALKFKDGSIVGGATLENAAYNPSVSAIRGAFSLASIMGKTKGAKNPFEECSFTSLLDSIFVCITSLTSENTKNIQDIQVREIFHYLNNLKITVPVTVITVNISTTSNLASLREPNIRQLPLY